MRWMNFEQSIRLTKPLIVKISKNIDASDSALLGPGSAVADISASEGTVVDNARMFMDSESFKIMVQLMRK